MPCVFLRVFDQSLRHPLRQYETSKETEAIHGRRDCRRIAQRSSLHDFRFHLLSEYRGDTEDLQVVPTLTLAYY